jgi:hypothetical protein
MNERGTIYKTQTEENQQREERYLASPRKRRQTTQLSKNHLTHTCIQTAYDIASISCQYCYREAYQKITKPMFRVKTNRGQAL